MDYLADNAPAYPAYLVATVSPGPATQAIIVTSAGAGRRAGLLFASGILAGSVIWRSAAALGLSIVMTHFAWVVTALDPTPRYGWPAPSLSDARCWA